MRPAAARPLDVRGTAPRGVVQRKCACSGKSSAGGSCEECNKEATGLQRYSATRENPAISILPADLAARGSAAPTSRIAYPLVQRAAMPGVTPDPTGNPAGVSPEAEPSNSRQSPAATLIVDDDADQVGPGQMRKGAFLDQLQRSVCAAADDQLARVGRNTRGCPYIEGWISHYRRTSAQYLERALRRYAPEAASAKSAADYIPAVTERVLRAVTLWATTGQISGIPEELKGQVPGAGLFGAVGAIAGAVSGVVGGIGRALGRIFRKARDGVIRDAKEPQEVRDQLGAGQPLENGTRSRMESAFGHSFSHVRVHTGAQAADLSNSLKARAFTIGSDVAFGAGEYRPGTPIGDALLAHELAHVVQQAGRTESATPMRKDEAQVESLEEDADLSAVRAVTAIWSGAARPSKGTTQDAAPRLRSGLGLRRCGGSKFEHITAPVPETATLGPGGAASFQINGVDVIAEQDSRSDEEKYRNRALTRFGLDLDRNAQITYDQAHDRVLSFTPPHIVARVSTIFGEGYDPRAHSTYGRGTTPEDLSDLSGRTKTLHFHESRHGEDWFNFLRQNPVPVFGGRTGMSRAEFTAAVDRFNQEIRDYNRRAVEYSTLTTDCPGTPATERDLAPLGLHAEICHQK